MNRPRLIRGLRIAWNIWWGILCVLLIWLWVRSYSYTYYADGCCTPTLDYRASVRIGLADFNTSAFECDGSWSIQCVPMSDNDRKAELDSQQLYPVPALR